MTRKSRLDDMTRRLLVALRLQKEVADFLSYVRVEVSPDTYREVEAAVAEILPAQIESILAKKE